jgi:hypothetical protein
MITGILLQVIILKSVAGGDQWFKFVFIGSKQAEDLLKGESTASKSER